MISTTKTEGKQVERWFVVLAIVSISAIAIIAAVTYYFSRPGEYYHLVLQHQWQTPPMTSATDPFTITGKEWYVDKSYVSYSLVPVSMDIIVRNASTHATINQTTLTNEHPKAYFDFQGTFYLSIRLNNATVEEQWVLVAVWELK